MLCTLLCLLQSAQARALLQHKNGQIAHPLHTYGVILLFIDRLGLVRVRLLFHLFYISCCSVFFLSLFLRMCRRCGTNYGHLCTL